MATIPLTQGRTTQIDDADKAAVIRHSWSFGAGYPQAKIRGAVVRLHRFLMGPKPGQTVDHIDGNTLNNTRANLRLCSQQRQTQNRRKKSSASSSRYKGVSWLPKRNIWRAVIRDQGASKLVGFFASEMEAAIAYDKAARLSFGEFARLNFPNVESVTFAPHPNRCQTCQKLFKHQRALRIHISHVHAQNDAISYSTTAGAGA